MQIRKDFLWRFYLCFVVLIIIGMFIIGKAFYIQQIQGKFWLSMSDSLHQHIQNIEAERGSIYSEDGQILSTSIPQYDLYLDFDTEYLNERNGSYFWTNVDSLSISLATLFNDKNAETYKRELVKGFKEKQNYYLLKRKVNFAQCIKLEKFSYFKKGRNKSGLIKEENSIRLNPYKMLALRTIGLYRDENKVGLELTYDSVLKGKNGQHLVRRIAGGTVIPIKDDPLEIESEMGKDIVCTIDTYIQEVTEKSLLQMMIKNDAENGCAIVMETKTGKIKAIANLGRTANNNYYEDLNYAITPSEPGSTFKLVSLMALIEDNKISLNNLVDLEKGTWHIANQTVRDSEKHGRNDVTVKQAFELSSNVGISKLIVQNYGNNPTQFFNLLSSFRLDSLTGIDLIGEKRPVFIKPGQKLYGPTTLPWVAFGYNLLISPLQTLMIYNAVANNGKLLKPYLVSTIKDQGNILKKIEPYIYNEQFLSPNTVSQLKECLEGVCTNGTGKELFKNTPYRVAGKTGTALVANGKRGYADHIYQSSFAGYFPAEDPQYTCIVVIKNKPFAKIFYGGSVAGPVFKNIADKLYIKNLFHAITHDSVKEKIDSTLIQYVVNINDLKNISKLIGYELKDSTKNNNTPIVSYQYPKNEIREFIQPSNTMPLLKNYSLKDALFTCEQIGLIVHINGNGRVNNQSIESGKPVMSGQHINLELK